MSGFPTMTGSVPMSLAEGLSAARQIATTLKTNLANSWLPGAQTSGLPSPTLLSIPQTLIGYLATLNQAAALSGMAAYAQAQLNNDANIATQFSAMTAAMTAVVNWINANFPAANGYLAYQTYNSATGVVTPITFTTTQLAGLVPLLQALQAALD